MHGEETNCIAELMTAAYSFGAESARTKARLLAQVEAKQHIGVRDLARLYDVLSFVQAYPDNARVLGRAERILSSFRGRLESLRIDRESPVLQDLGFPGAENRCVFSFPMIQHLQRRFPECLELDWDAIEDHEPLLTILGLCVTPGEWQGLDDIQITVSSWFERTRADSMVSDLEYLIHLLTHSSLAPSTRDALFELVEFPVRYRALAEGSARCELRWPVDRVHYQKGDFRHEHYKLESVIAKPFERARRLSPAAGARFVDLALRALFTRNLEIRTLSYANPRDVWLADCGRGVQVGLIGVVPRYRDPLECHTCALILKNGIPIAYGPATATLGCCEIGLNVFPQVRGAEVRFIYPQFMRAIHHVLGARYFHLTAYGMGEGNAAAINTGAFWFYRKLGFSATNPDVEALALEEEQRMRAKPGYRSDKKMLRRLSHTGAHCDLSEGECRVPNLGAIGVSLSRFLASEYGSHRALAERRCIRRAARILGEDDPSGRGWELLAPILCMIPDLQRWSRPERGRLARIVRAKGAVAESGVDRMICGHPRLREALLALGEE